MVWGGRGGTPPLQKLAGRTGLEMLLKRNEKGLVHQSISSMTRWSVQPNHKMLMVMTAIVSWIQSWVRWNIPLPS